MNATKIRKAFSKTELKSRLKNGRLVTDSDYRYAVLCGVGLAIAVIAYTLLYATRVFTVANGWACTYYSLMQEGNVPYRDFYYYLPPGNLVMNWIIYTLSGKYLVMAAWLRIVERVALCEFLYTMVAKRTTPLLGTIASFMSMVLASSAVTELGGDYNQTTYFTLVLLLYFFLKYEEKIELPLRKKAGYLIAVGVCGGVMFTIKQTIVLTSFLAFFVLLAFLFLVGKEKQYLSACLFVLIGAVFALAPFGAYLLATGALKPFIQQVFLDTSAKGGTESILTGHIGTFFKENIEKICAIFALLAAYVVGKKQTRLLKKVPVAAKSGMEMGLLLLAVALFSHMLYEKLWDGVAEAFKSWLFVPLLLVLALVLVPSTRKKCYAAFVGAAVAATIWILIFNIGDMTRKFYENTSMFSVLRVLVGYGFLAVLLWLIYHLVVGFLHKKQFAFEKITFACAGLAAAGATLINNGVDDISTGCAYLVVPALTVIVFQNIQADSARMQRCTKTLAAMMLCVLCVSASQKLVEPYSWWGYTAEDFWSKTETSSLTALKGYKLSEKDIKLYDEVTKVIEDNTDESSVIFGFPYVKCYNALIGNYNMDNFVPVLFYDTCADDYARADAKLLAENEPDIVVWLDVNGCMETHEKLFRGGNELGQRQIQKWFYSVRKSDYTCIAQVDNLYVYKLTKNGQTVNSTYIQRPSRPNGTAVYTSTQKAVVDLEGEGTKEEPYLVSSFEDFKYFRDVVNAGKIDLEDCWFRQTADIDLKEISSWTPIGVYGEGNYFEGVYDGDGYEIRNLTIKADKKNVGLFGVLDGTVMNLNLINCDISGGCVGGITSHGSAEIYNCYVCGELYGSGRAGGVADNASADIVNCVTEVSITSKGLACGISGYYTNDIYHCYSRQGDNVCIDDGLAIPTNAVESLNAYCPKDDRLEVDEALLNQWVKTADGLRVGHEKRDT